MFGPHVGDAARSAPWQQGRGLGVRPGIAPRGPRVRLESRGPFRGGCGAHGAAPSHPAARMAQALLRKGKVILLRNAAQTPPARSAVAVGLL